MLGVGNLREMDKWTRKSEPWLALLMLKPVFCVCLLPNATLGSMTVARLAG